MSFLSTYQFAFPWALLLAPLLWLAWYFFYVKKKQNVGYLKISDTSGLAQSAGLKQKLLRFLPLLPLLGLTSLIVALSGPQRFLNEEVINAEGIDIVLSIDVSPSMLSKDFIPDRLEVSKKVAADFVDKRTYDRIGLTLFSGEAYTQSPLTTDHAIIKTFLANTQAGLLKSGTAIGMGLATAVNRLKDSEAKSKIVILLTDGENNSGYIDPITAAGIAKEFGIKVYTIGVGTNGTAMSPINIDRNGKYIYGPAEVNIDEGLLTEISTQTGGRYYRALDEQALLSIYDEIDSLEKTEIEALTFKRYKNEFRFFALLGFGFLLVFYFLNHTYLSVFP